MGAVQASGSTIYFIDRQHTWRTSEWKPDRGYLYRGALSADGTCFAAIADEYDDYGKPANLLIACDTSVSEAAEDRFASDEMRMVLGAASLSPATTEQATASLKSSALRPSAVKDRPSVLASAANRLFVAHEDSTIRFYETKDWRELAVIRVPQVVTDLKMTADGTRLVLMHADGSARIWDIRDPAERLKDREREWAEQPEADKYVDALLAGPRATADLDAFLRADESLTPLRRMVAWRTLRDRLADLERESSDRYAAAAKLAEQRQIKDKPAFVQLLEAELAAAKDLSPRVAEKARALGEKWEYREMVASEAQQLAEETKKRRSAEAMNVLMSARRDDFGSTPLTLQEPSLRSLREAVATLEDVHGRTSLQTVEALTLLAAKVEDTDEAADLYSDAASRLEEVTPQVNVRLVELWCRAANALALRCDFARAEAYYAKVAENAEAVLARNGDIRFAEIPLGNMGIDEFSAIAGLSGFSTGTNADGRVSLVVKLYRTANGPTLRRWIAGELTSRAAYWIGLGKNVERSIVSLKRAVLADASHLRAHRELARVYLKVRRPVDALEAVWSFKERAETSGTAVDDADRFATQALLAMVRQSIAHADREVLLRAGEIDVKHDAGRSRSYTADEHRTAAREALAKARALLAVPHDRNSGQPDWSKDEWVQSLLREATELVDGEEPKP